MPWMYLNVMKKSDVEMKTSIYKQIELRKLNLAPKKSYYTYLILDIAKYNAGKTKISESSLLPHEASMHDFLLFRSCILYVGKGISNRKHMHLTLAKQLYLGLLPKRKISLKVSKIASLWEQGKGITLIQLDCDATSYEAFTRENCIIKSLNFNMLTNRIRGTSYGNAKFWPLRKIVNYGNMLIYSLFNTFLTKQPNVIYANDVVLKTQNRRKRLRICTKCKNKIR
jgi:hypothetical protein